MDAAFISGNPGTRGVFIQADLNAKIILRLTVPLNVHPLTVLALAYSEKENMASIDELLTQIRKEVIELLELAAPDADKK